MNETYRALVGGDGCWSVCKGKQQIKTYGPGHEGRVDAETRASWMNQAFAAGVAEATERLRAALAAAEAERDRLREALRRISINTNDNGSGAADFARAALAKEGA